MKENDKIGYVYLTTNLLNGKQYVGQHLHDGFDKGYKGSGIAITNAINKYGWDNFKCEVLCWCSTQTQLNEAEDNYIKLLGTMSPNGYNLKGGGSKGKPCKEAKKKCSETLKKYYESEENRNKISEALKGHQTTKETRKKISESNKGKKRSEEARKKYSFAKKGKPSGMKGKHHTKESREKNSLKHKGIGCKKVFQYTLNGEFVKEWCSLIEIQRQLGFNCGHISDCCNGKKKTAYKHLWKFAS